MAVIMAVGIYRLHFSNGQDYIGQSSSLKRRYLCHLNLLTKHKHYNSKLQACYDLYGEPEAYIEELCSIPELDALEIFYINKYNSYKYGLNIVPGGSLQHGDANPNHKYSNQQIIDAFLLGYDKKRTIKEISKLTGVSEAAIRTILIGSRHEWLKELYPTEYNLMLACKQVQNHNNFSYRIIKDSIIEEFTVLAEAGRKLGLDPGNLSKLCNGKLKKYKGWELYDKRKITEI